MVAHPKVSAARAIAAAKRKTGIWAGSLAGQVSRLLRRGEGGAPGGRKGVGSVGASPANARRFPVRLDLDCGFVFDRGEIGEAAALYWRG
jgi:hypothetical protein